MMKMMSPCDGGIVDGPVTSGHIVIEIAEKTLLSASEKCACAANSNPSHCRCIHRYEYRRHERPRADTEENENADDTDASHRRFSQMIFADFFFIICVPESYFHSRHHARRRADTDENENADDADATLISADNL